MFATIIVVRDGLKPERFVERVGRLPFGEYPMQHFQRPIIFMARKLPASLLSCNDKAHTLQKDRDALRKPKLKPTF
ncbi:Uncharacterised protein [BD1-7 clade bacterium]|uniref:Uncharacterized protein n=1 Tax=BD1-7 clade bacterium TaxID=2029982 RepID=A0A5S9QYW0_9GAMM|nr:Uncharacterised protein [BD1-7 clade bacterium]